MKRAVLATLSLVMLLSVLSISATAVEGDENIWRYLPQPKVKDDSGACVRPEEGDTRPQCVRVVGGNTFLKTYEDGWWEGAFVGTSEDHGSLMIHRSGNWNFRATVYFEGAVNGRSGTLVMSVNGSRPDAVTEWQGGWVILSGTGELETLRGQGTWWGPGFIPPPPGEPRVPGIIYYDGKFHFAP